MLKAGQSGPLVSLCQRYASYTQVLCFCLCLALDTGTCAHHHKAYIRNADSSNRPFAGLRVARAFSQFRITHSVVECCKRTGRDGAGRLRVNGVPVNAPAIAQLHEITVKDRIAKNKTDNATFSDEQTPTRTHMRHGDTTICLCERSECSCSAFGCLPRSSCGNTVQRQVLRRN